MFRLFSRRSTPSGYRRWLGQASRLVPVLLGMMLSACATKPITPQTISGRYEMIGKPVGLWYAGESLVLGEGTFQYSLFSALADDPRLAMYPVSGRYSLDGATITLHHAGVLFPERTIARYQKQFVLLTPKQRESYRETRSLPEDALLQSP